VRALEEGEGVVVVGGKEGVNNLLSPAYIQYAYSAASSLQGNGSTGREELWIKNNTVMYYMRDVKSNIRLSWDHRLRLDE
jgi:hypothetical protein